MPFFDNNFTPAADSVAAACGIDVDAGGKSGSQDRAVFFNLNDLVIR
jgi:hypothetical protein